MPYFVFGQERDWDGYGQDTFAVFIKDRDQVAHARGLIAGSETDRPLIGGLVTMAPADYNIGWSFHIAPADLGFADGFTEIGDNDIRGVEAGVNAFGDGFLPGNRWTPWTVYIVTELKLVTGGINADNLQGTQLPDIVFGRAGHDFLSGGEGDDHLVGDRGMDRLQGGSGRDKLSGGDGDDILQGGGGTDILDGGLGTDTLAGGAGNDTYHVRAGGDVITEAAAGGVDAVWSWISYTLADGNVEDLRLMDTGFASIDGTGNALDNRIWGNWGGNLLSGGDGDDILDGHGGNDVLVGGNGDDTLIGGGGDMDTASYAAAAGAVRVSLALTTPQNTLGAGTDTFAAMPWETMTSIENVAGSAFADTLRGNSEANSLNGGAGADRLEGDAGNDRLNGGGGHDRLCGGAGRDTLTGGAGADGFRFDAAPGAANTDRVLDFSAADDTILLDRSVFAAIAADGTLAASAFHAGTAAQDAGDRIVYDAATGRIFYDADGSGAAAAILFATVAAGTSLTFADFNIVP
jgi:serralysin